MLRILGLATQIKHVEAAELIRQEMSRDRNLPHASDRHLQSAAGD